MSMQEWPDDHLDDLFRKSAEEFDVPYDPAHWDKLTTRLDENDRQAFYDRWHIWGGAAALTGLLLITLWWAWKVTTVAANPVTVMHLPTTSRPTPGVVNKPVATPDWAARSRKTTGQWRRRVATNLASQALPEHRALATRQPGTGTDRVGKTGNDQLANGGVVNKYLSRSATDRVVLAKARRQKRDADKPLTNELPDDENELITTLNRSGSTTTNRIDEQPSPVTQRVVRRGKDVQSVPTLAVTEPDASTEKTAVNGHRSDSSPEPTSSAKASVKRSGGFSDQPQPVQQTSDLGTVVMGQPVDAVAIERLWLGAATPASSRTAVKTGPLASFIEPEESDIQQPAKRVVVPRQRFSVMAVYSPDLSAIELNDLTKPGSNAGLMFQYRLSNRFSVQMGALASTKKYQSASDYYMWPDSPSFKWGPWPDNISGVCTMYDVPINLRYDWLLRPRGDGMPPARWFISTGLTSYFIRHETYTYAYDDPTNPKITHWGWDNEKAGVAGGKFGFSNLNVSLGYERPLSRHLSWQVEPFMKIPLREVGLFRVKLISTGAFVGLKYSF